MTWKGGLSLDSTLSISSSESSLSEGGFSESSETSVSGSWSPPSSLQVLKTPAAGSTDSVVSMDSTSSVSTIKLSSGSNLYPEEEEFGEGHPPLLRKKSGELVKSSLKLPALARCKSTSNVLMKKSVSFASRLENIKMFDGKDSPSVVSTNDNSPMESPSISRSGGRSSYFSWDWDNGNDDDDGYDDYSTSDEDEILRKSWEIKSTDVLCSVPFNLQNEKRPVFLQSIAVSPDKKSLFGFILVKNLAFEKKLSVKLTTSNWKSSIIISNAIYIQSFRSSHYDQFKFSMPLSNYKSLINMELVVKYDVGSDTFWDNNDNKNYHIEIRAIQQLPKQIRKRHPTISNRNSIPEFEDLVSRLVTIKNDLDDENSDITPRSKSAFSGRYNFMNEELPKRPVLKTSFSQSDVNTIKPKYSNSFKSRNSAATANNNVGTSSTTNVDKPTGLSNDTNFNSKSYTDLLNSYCFYKGDESRLSSNSSSNSKPKNLSRQNTSAHTPTTVPISAASTFHFLSDSIHI
ncbi:hypothetical protein CAAN1_16S00452 [[Candida] anglica]|uniref:CBM21 domain-containing protein n=1 Tax=[Candida] anglica TaxID=148631 RepID=A0ABP0EC79_9ASCO